MTTTPPSITALPAAPDPANRGTFNTLAYPWSAALPTFGTQVSAVATNVKANADEAYASAIGAAAQTAAATAQAVAAAGSAALAGATAWVSGTTYAIGDARYSLINFFPYRRTTNGAGTTDPASDTANWTKAADFPIVNATYNQTALVTLPVGTATNALYDRLSIDATRELLIFTSTTAVQAVVWDNTARVFGTAVLVRAFAAAPGVGALLIGTDKVLVLSAPASSAALEAVVLTFSGTTITVNTAATQTMPQALSSSADGKLNGIAHNGVACGSSYVFSLKLASSCRTIAVTVSGTTPTIGTSLDMVSTALCHIRPIDATRLLCLYVAGAVVSVVPVTVSAGTTLTAGTSASFGAGASAWRHFTALTTGRWAVAYTNTNSYGAIVSVSGTVATVSTVLLNAAADMSNGAVVKIGDQLVVQCSTTKVNVLTDVSGTATAGTAVTTQTTASGGACVGFGSTYAVFISNGSSTYDIIKVSGNDPVLYEQGGAPTGLLSSGDEEWSDSYPGRVLSSATRSATVAKGGSPTTLAFTASGPQDICNVSPSSAANNTRHQSASVLWAAYCPATSATVRVYRMEML